MRALAECCGRAPIRDADYIDSEPVLAVVCVRCFARVESDTRDDADAHWEALHRATAQTARVI